MCLYAITIMCLARRAVNTVKHYKPYQFRMVCMWWMCFQFVFTLLILFSCCQLWGIISFIHRFHFFPCLRTMKRISVFTMGVETFVHAGESLGCIRWVDAYVLFMHAPTLNIDMIYDSHWTWDANISDIYIDLGWLEGNYNHKIGLIFVNQV